jgi:hypothetical protein
MFRWHDFIASRLTPQDRCAEDEKFLLTYIIFKLKLVKGKVIIFVADVDRSYRKSPDLPLSEV